MRAVRLFALFLGLILVSSTVFAQSSVENPRKRLGVRSSVSGLETLSIPKSAPNTAVPSGYKNYEDESLDEFNSEMKEKAWGSEDTAWQRACDLNNSKAYERYLAIYPYGAHAPEATEYLVRTKVDETLANAHTNLPEIKRTEEDDSSPETTLIIQNNTGLILTVYCSGIDNKQVVILPDKKGVIKFLNGQYKLAASVPPSHIRPYAGQTYFQGGTYEVGFWVVTQY